MITLSIDVTLLDKSRFKHVTRKNGKPAIFAELVLIDTPNSEFGNDYSVKQSISKEEREEGVQMPFLGNAKHVVPVKKAVREIQSHVEKTVTEDGDDIPF